MQAHATHPRTADHSTIRWRLLFIVGTTTAIALLLAGASMLSHDLLVYRQSWVSDLQSEASMLALSTAPALAFDDKRSAQRNLNALQARQSLMSAGLYDRQGLLFASFQRAGEMAAPLHLTGLAEGIEVQGARVELSRRIVQNGEFLGTIYLRAHYDVAGRVKAYSTIFVAVTLFSMLIALWLSATLRRSITRPLDGMTDVARRAIDDGDYSQRVEQPRDNEVGVVVDAFNRMLDEVQSRTQALEASNRALLESEKLYRAIGESIDYGVWICDANGRPIYVSDSFLRLTGLTQTQCAESGWSDVLHPDERQQIIANWRQNVRTGEPWYLEHRIRATDGSYRPVLAQGVPIRADSGEITGWAGINLDISRLKATEDALREADRRKDEFLATLAHELRNPLAPIRNAARILDTPAANEQQRQWGRDVIARQVHHMSLLLDDLLDVSRITRGRLELKKSVVTLQSLVSAALETSRPLLDSKHHVVEVSLPPRPVQLNVDALRISQALSNLLTNAAKYTDPGGRIRIAATLDAQALTISVSDNGIGLSPAALSNVFEMFSQVTSAVDRSQGGLGIGLALVKGLVSLHGGFVQASSAGENQGSTFSVVLPESVVVAAPAAAGAPSQEYESPRVACRILVADDNRDAAASMAMLLEVEGYEVCLAHSGSEALELGERAQPEVCILDIGMPDMNGYETARRMRQISWGQRALLIAVTGWGQKEDKDKASAAGFDRHFTKPVDLDVLQAAIARFMETRQSGAAAPIS